jgi:hypothetical protein
MQKSPKIKLGCLATPLGQILSAQPQLAPGALPAGLRICSFSNKIILESYHANVGNFPKIIRSGHDLLGILSTGITFLI